MRLCYVLSYRAPNYIRTQTLLEALRRIPEIDLSLAINTSMGIKRYQETLSRVARLERSQSPPEAYLLGFRGQEIYWPLRRLVGNKPIIIDAMMSPSLALVQENQYGMAGKAASFFLKPIEKYILHDAALVVTDTEAHVQAFREHYRLATDKIHAIPVGAVETAPQAVNPGSRDRLRVLFYGSFLPLHGFDTILSACEGLGDLPLDLDFIGTNPSVEMLLQKRLSQAGQLRYRTRRWVEFEDILQTELPDSDLCLGGPFGNTPQARRVITGKTFQALAQAVPVLVGEGEATGVFLHQNNVLSVPQGQPGALREAIFWAWQNRSLLPAIGVRGRESYYKHFSIQIIAQKFGELLKALVKGS